MNKHAIVWLAVCSLNLGSCATPTTSKSPPSPTVSLRLDAHGLKLTHPLTGDTFCLNLGDELYQDCNGFSAVPRGLPSGFRKPTGSYYRVTTAEGGGRQSAESMHSRRLADLVVRTTQIQYQPDSGRLLISENLSDGRPCKRFILYSLLAGGGYRVTYLSPPLEPRSGDRLLKRPPAIQLLTGDRAEIAGRIWKIAKIPQDIHPFSVGG